MTTKIDLTPYQTNHLLHLILSIVTGGLWLIVWFFVAATDREMRNALINAGKIQPKPKRSEFEKTLIAMAVIFIAISIFFMVLISLFAK